MEWHFLARDHGDRHISSYERIQKELKPSRRQRDEVGFSPAATQKVNISLSLPVGLHITLYSCWRRQPSNCQLRDSSSSHVAACCLKMETQANGLKNRRSSFRSLLRLCISVHPNNSSLVTSDASTCHVTALFPLSRAAHCSVFKHTSDI